MKISYTNNGITFAIGRERDSDSIDVQSVRTKEDHDKLLGSLDGDYIVCNGQEAFLIAQTILNDFRYYALEEDKVPPADSLPF